MDRELEFWSIYTGVYNLGSDPSLSYYHIVKDWGDKWVEKGEISQALVDCILNVNASPGKNYGLIKTHNQTIRLG